MKITITFHVREIRQERGLTIRQLADLSGVSKSLESGTASCCDYEEKMGLYFG